jgi:arylsulfatase
MYVAYTAAHWPMHALEKDVAKYHGKYDAGYGPIRQRRLERTRQLGLIHPDWELTPQVGDWEELSHKAWEARCMEVYAAMIDNLDQGIGRIVAELEKTGRLENALILFLQDNGACQEGVGRKGEMTRPEKPTLPRIADDAIRLEVHPKQNRAGIPTLRGPNVMPGPEDTYIAYGINWANVSNTPFREYKHFVHEGGISTPLIAHWPARIQRRGELEHQPGHLVDLMATCVDVAGADYPKRYRDEEIQPMEGRSLLPAFEGRTIQREAIYWEHEGNRAVRVGKWKLVAKGAAGPWELYDMEADRTEMHDLSPKHPEQVEQMVATWEAWARRANVIPWIWKPPYGVDPQETFSRETEFELGPDVALPREESPYVKGKPLAITVHIDRMAPDGVLVAQGGSSHGYALYLEEGRLSLATRHGGELTVISAGQQLPANTTTVAAALAADGTVTLAAGDEQIASGKTARPLDDMPIDGLEVGRDEKGAVGPYTMPYAFGGKIGQVKIHVGK